MPRRFILLPVALLAFMALAQSAAAAKKEATIAVLAFRGMAETLKRWSPTANYLTQNVPGHKFRIVPPSLDQIGGAAWRGRAELRPDYTRSGRAACQSYEDLGSGREFLD